MFYTGQKVLYYKDEAVVLTCSGDDVLIMIGKHFTKWVDKKLLDLLKKA